MDFLARCPECGERIGGASHRLDRTNRVATVMDGATRSAYERDMDFNEAPAGDFLRRLQLE